MNRPLDLKEPIEQLSPRIGPITTSDAGTPAGKRLPDRLREALHAARQDQEGRGRVVAHVLAATAELIDAEVVAFVVARDGALSVRDMTLDARHREMRARLASELRLAASEALRGMAGHVEASSALPGSAVIACALPDKSGAVAALVGAAGLVERARATLELLANAIAAPATSADDDPGAALFALIAAFEGKAAADPIELSERLASVFGARLAIVAALDGSVLAMSRATALRKDSPGETAIRELIGRASGALVPVVETKDAGPRSLPAVLGADSVVAFQLKPLRRGTQRVCLLVEPKPAFARMDAEQWRLVRATLDGLATDGRRPRRNAKRLLRGSAALFAAAIVGALMFVPVADRIRAEAELEPEGRRVVTASFNAVVRHAIARPGDKVAIGTPVAELEGEELVLSRAAAAARASEAFRRSDAAVHAKDITEAELARLEGVAAEAERDLLDWQLGQLQLASPIAGLVIASPFEDADGAPVREGDVIAEIAPIDRLRVRVDVPVEDFRRLEAVETGELHVDGMSGGPIALADFSRASRAEARDGQTVIALRTTIDNPGRTLRPGQKAVVLLPTGSARLGEILFRNAWQELRRWAL